MNSSIAGMISRAAVSSWALTLLMAAICHAALPELVPPSDITSATDGVLTEEARLVAQEAANDDLVNRMLTPRAEIRLGPGKADTQRLMERSSTTALSYTLRSLWRGIIEYVFPPHGLFRRDDALARIYDPDLLTDLERARAQIHASDARGITIAAAPRRRTQPHADPEATVQEPPVPQPPARIATGTPAAPRPPARAAAPAPALPEIEDFDFEENRRRQDQLREQAELTGAAVSAAVSGCSVALDAVTAASDELAQRHRLLEEGVLAREALQPAEDRLAEAKRGYARAEAVLIEAQEGYDRIARQISELEDEARESHERIQTARAARAQAAESAARQAATSPPTATPPPASEAPAEVPQVTLERRDDEPHEVEAPAAAPVQPITREMRELSAPRWNDLTGAAPGVVSEIIAPEGTLVEPGDELLRVANLQLAQLTTFISTEDLPRFRLGRSVTVCFEDYPDTLFEGWISDVTPCAGSEEAEVSLLVVCRAGRFADDPYMALRWMTLEAGVGRDKVSSLALDPVMEPVDAQAELRLHRIFPTIGPRELYEERVTQAQQPSNERFTGRLQLKPMERLAEQGLRDEKETRRLAALSEWRESFVEGMTTTILDDGTCISYPAGGEINAAVQSMLRGRVSHRPNLCAATMREALGWGLGDAHQWATRLPHMGDIPREDGIPRPGDILGWPFTYGPNRSQHIGIAVRQGRKLMHPSYLSGHLGTTELVGGFISFYKPAEKPQA